MPAYATFDHWMAEVDAHLDAAADCGHLDLPDWGYWDAYDAGMTPLKAARKALEAAGGF